MQRNALNLVSVAERIQCVTDFPSGSKLLCLMG